MHFDGVNGFHGQENVGGRDYFKTALGRSLKRLFSVPEIILVMLGVLLIPQQALALYTGANVQGMDVKEVKKVVLVLPGNKKETLVSKDECERDRGDCRGAAAWYLKSASALPAGTTGEVEVTDEDGIVTPGTFSVGPNGEINVSVSTLPHSRLSDTQPSFNLKIAYREDDLGDNNAPIGTVIRTGGEFGGIFAAVKYSGVEYEAEGDNLGSIGIGDNPFFLSARVWYFNPDEENVRARIPEGTDDVAIVYPYAMPNTGVFLGTTGLDLGIESEYSEWGIGANLSGKYRPLGDSGWNWRPIFGLVYLDSDQEIKATARSITYGDTVMAMNDQTLTDKFLGVPLSIEIGHSLASWFKKSASFERMADFFAGATVTPGYRWSDLDGYMKTRCDLCGVSDQMLLFNYDDEDDGFAYELEVYTGLNFPVTQNLNLGLKVDWHYKDKVAVAENVVSPGPAPPYNEYKIGDDSQSGWSGSLLLGISF